MDKLFKGQGLNASASLSTLLTVMKGPSASETVTHTPIINTLLNIDCIGEFKQPKCTARSSTVSNEDFKS